MLFGLFPQRRKTPLETKAGQPGGVVIERLERRVLLNAVPDVSVDVADEALIGESVDFTITFDLDDAAAGPGFGPFIDIVLPRNGADGAAGTDTPDGIGTDAAVSFEFFGTSLTPVLDVVVDGTGTVEHPLLRNPDGSPTVVTGLTPGDRFIVLQLPLGSYEPSTVPLEINGTANLSNLADVGVALPIEVRGGFQFGCTPEDDPRTDDPNATVSGFSQDSVTPEVLLINKVVNADEQETATGPNFPNSYTLQVDIADGQAISGLQIEDPLSDRIVYLNNVQLGGASPDSGSGVIRDPEPTINMGPQTGETLIIDYGSVAGTQQANDLSVTFDFYVPEADASGNPIIDPTSGAPTTTQNSAKATYSWDPIDDRDALVVDAMVEDPLDGADQQLTNRAIAIQKSVTVAVDNHPGVANPAPGDVLEYRIEFQVSDYFDFNNIVLSDLLSNGQSFDSSFAPELSLLGNAGNPSPQQDFNSSNFDAQVDPGNAFGTSLVFRVSDELSARGLSATIQGNEAGSPGTTGVVIYRAVVDSTYRDGDTEPSNDIPVTEGDRLSNSVRIEGTVVNPDGTEGGTPTDGSNAGVSIPRGSVDKEVYAVNGDLNAPLIGSPGDAITYRIQYVLPQTRFADLVLTDTLPLPILDASTLTTPVFDSILTGSNVPAVGQITYGPDAQEFFDLYYVGAGLQPTLSIGPGNEFTLSFPDFAADIPQPTTIDLLFTVEFADFPFADGLFLSNIIVSQQGSNNGGTVTDGDLAQIVSNTPELNLTKGVVSTDTGTPPAEFDPNSVGPVSFADPGTPGAAFTSTITSGGLLTDPIDSDLSNVDAGDLVKFAIVVENTGNGEGFDLIINDTLPVGFVVPTGGLGLNLQVAQGDGNPLTFTDADGSAIAAGSEDDYFFTTGVDGRGIRIVDPEDLDPVGNERDGAIDGVGTDGKNIIVVTFDLQVSDVAEAGGAYTDTGTLARFGGVNNGRNWTVGVDGDFTDDATVTLVRPEIEKRLLFTEFDNPVNGLDEAVIGELATFEILVTIPEGVTENVVVVDDFGLFGNMAFVSLDGIVASTDLTSSVGDIASIVPTVTDQGQLVEFQLGTITNSNRDNAVAETISITLTGVVLNDQQNQSQTEQRNSSLLTFEVLGHPVDQIDTSEPIVVIEPDVEVLKTATVNGDAAPPGTGDAGDPVQYTITIQHSGVSETDAFDLQFSDPLPARLVNASIVSVTDSAGALSVNDFQIVGGVLQLAIAGNPADNEIDFPMTRSVTIVVGAEIAQSVVPGEEILNIAEIEWTSLDGDVGPRSIYNPNSTERTGVDGPDGALNDYAAQGVSRFNVLREGLVKSIVATSEDHTGVVGQLERVAIGEIVRYRLVIEVPEATYIDAALQDRIPGGLAYLNDGTTTVAFVGDDPTLFTSTGFPAGEFGQAFVAGDESTVAAIVPTYVLDDSQISANPNNPNDDNFTSGRDVYFAFGDVINAEDDANLEFVVVEFNALVLNISGNQAGTTRTNRFNALFEGQVPNPVVSNSARVRISEPDLEIDKEIVTAPQDAGDGITYAITVESATGGNTTTAFDINITDLLDSNLDLTTVIVSSAPAGSNVLDNSDTGIGNRVDVVIDRMDPGDSVVILVSAGVLPDTDVGLEIPNTAEVTYTSLPGERGTPNNPTGSELPAGTIGDPGNTFGERTGDGNGPNDYFDSFTVSTVLDTPTVEKFVDPAEYTIGEIIQYQLLVTLPEGTTRELVVVDDFPLGLEYVSHTLVTDPSLSGGELLTQAYVGNLSAPVSNNPSGSGSDLELTFGNVLTTADNNATNDSFVVLVEARVLNEIGNQNGDVLENTGQVRYEDPNTLAQVIIDTSAVDVRLVEPELVVDKEITSPPAGAEPDAGDVLQYTVTIAHDGTSTADAFEVQFADLAPANTLITGVVSVTSTGVATPLAEIAVDGSSIVLSDVAGSGEFDLPQGATVTLVYEVTIQNSVGPGETITNRALMEWSSLNGDVDSGELRGERDGSSRPNPLGVNDYFDGDQATITTDVPEFDKTLVSSSLTDTVGSQLAIGEQVTFWLTVTLPEATYPNDFVVTDVLPTTPGVLQYVSAQYLASESDSNIQIGNVNVAHSGDTVTFTLTDLVNPAATGTNDNLLVFEVVAVVSDVPENVNGDVLTNTGTVGYPGFSESDTATVSIVESAVMIDKSSLTSQGSAGDFVTYTLQVTNAAGDGATANAYDLVISDDLLNGLGLDDTLDLVVGSVTAATTGAGSLTIDEGNGFGDDAIVVSASVLEIDQTITITFVAQLNANVDPTGDLVVNTSKVTSDSLPGEDPNQRDYSDEDSHTLTTPQEEVGIDKSVVSTSEATTDSAQYDPNIVDLAMGEIVTYQITIDLPAGTYNDPIIVDDQLPDFLALLGGASDVRVVSVGADIDLNDVDVVTADNVGGDGYDDQLQITFDVSQVALPRGGLPADASIVIEVDAQVLNVLGNQATGSPLTNTANVTFAQFTDSDSVEVELVEPELELVKDIIDQSAPTLGAGDTVTYQVTLEHAAGSTQAAHETQFTDVAPPGTLITNVQIATTGFTIAPTATITGGGTGLRLDGASAGQFDMPLGATITLTYTLTLQDSVQVGDTLTNDAFVDWSSLSGSVAPGTETGERDGSGARDPSDLNNYFDSDNETVVVGGFLELEKTTLNGNTFTIGDTVQYELEVSVFEGTTTDLVIIDDIPDLLQVSNVQIMAGPQFTFLDAPQINFDGDVLTVDLGDVVNLGDNNAANDSFTITYDALIVNDPANNGGDVKANLADATSSNGLTDDADAVIGIVEPELIVDKSISDDTPHLGDTVTYTFVITNIGDSDAFDLLIMDTLPPEVALELGTIVVLPMGTIFQDNSTGNTVNIAVDELAVGESVIVTFAAEVTSDIADYGTTFSNTVTVDYDNQPGENPEQRPGTTDDTENATIVGPDLEVVKDADVDVLFPGDSYNYSIVVTNKTGPFADVATGIVVTDQLPEGVTPLSSVPPFNSYNSVTGEITWLIDELQVGESATIQLQVALSDPAPATEIVRNEVVVTHDDVDPTPPDNRDDARTPIDESVTPDLTVTKDDGVIQVFPGDIITYDIVVTNVGPQTTEDVVVSDTFPDDVLTFVSASDGGVYDPVTGMVEWNLDELAGNGGQVTLTLTAQVKTTVVDPTIMEFTNLVNVSAMGPDPTPENNTDSDTDKVLFYGTDAFNDYLDDEREPWRPVRFRPQPMETYMSGIADPGTTLYIEIRDGTGDLLGWRSVTVDAGGNYFANFQGVSLDDGPHNSYAHQTLAADSAGHGGYNLRRYYEPAPHMATYFGERLQVESVFRDRASEVLRAMQLSDERPIQLSDLSTLAAYQSRVASFPPG